MEPWDTCMASQEELPVEVANPYGKIYPKINLPKGFCNLCGRYRALNCEHVPPQASLNKYRYIVCTADEYWNKLMKGQKIGKAPVQGGHGIYSICEECNNWTGINYGKAFVQWSKQGYDNYEDAKKKGVTAYFLNIQPLAILKQLATMFVALHMHDPGFRAKNLDLARFAYFPELRTLDPRYRFWLYYVAPGPLRMTKFSGILKTDGTAGPMFGMEISYPPFGYMMTFGSSPQDERLFQITGFKNYRFKERKIMKMHLPILPTHGPMTGDYRSFGDLPDRRLDDIRYIITMH